MCWVMVDVEADGPIPGDYSMVALGAVKVEEGLTKKFYAELQPISDKWIPDHLAICKFTRQQTLQFENPEDVMKRFTTWLHQNCGHHFFFISDNVGFDWQFVNWYFHHFTGDNPFGFASTDLLSIYKGLVKDMYHHYKANKYTPTHNALQDALDNANSLLNMKTKYGLKINW